MMTYWSVDPPTRWQAAVSAPGTPSETIHYFDCADCGAEDSLIAGILSSDGTYLGIGLLGSSIGDYRPAMFCQTCYDKRLAVAREEVAQ